jgi:hypothetical protein
VDSPVDHVFPNVELEVNVTLPPEQKDIGPLAEIVGVFGVGFTVIVIPADVAEQPALPTVTVYVPELETVIVFVVAPVDQVFPVNSLEVKVTLPPEQKVVGPLALIVGVVVVEFTVTICEADAETQPFASVKVKV